jgi:hypothetical protein
MNGNGKAIPSWGYAVEKKPSTMLGVALESVCRNGAHPQTLPECNGEKCDWFRNIAECLRTERCRSAVLFCEDVGLACCVANKVPGVRAVPVGTVAQARRALEKWGANLLVVETAGRTFYECKELLRLCQACGPAACPPGVATVLEELDGHAHR